MQQKILIGLILTLIIVVFIPVYWVTELSRQETTRNRQQAESIIRGSEIYHTTCSTCHGGQGEGGIGPALKMVSLDDITMGKIIARGVPGTAMLAWGKEDGGPFHQQQIRDLVTFIKNWNNVPTTTPVTTSPAMPSATDAAQLYATKCAICHGVNREGVSGLGPSLTPEKLGALSDAEIKDTISGGRAGTVMPAFKSTLSVEEMNTLLQFIKYTP